MSKNSVHCLTLSIIAKKVYDFLQNLMKLQHDNFILVQILKTLPEKPEEW